MKNIWTFHHHQFFPCRALRFMPMFYFWEYYQTIPLLQEVCKQKMCVAIKRTVLKGKCWFIQFWFLLIWLFWAFGEKDLGLRLDVFPPSAPVWFRVVCYSKPWSSVFPQPTHASSESHVCFVLQKSKGWTMIYLQEKEERKSYNLYKKILAKRHWKVTRPLLALLNLHQEHENIYHESILRMLMHHPFFCRVFTWCLYFEESCLTK